MRRDATAAAREKRSNAGRWVIRAERAAAQRPGRVERDRGGRIQDGNIFFKKSRSSQSLSSTEVNRPTCSNNLVLLVDQTEKGIFCDCVLQGSTRLLGALLA